MQYALAVLFIIILEIVAAILVFIYRDEFEVRDRLAAQPTEEEEASGVGSENGV